MAEVNTSTMGFHTSELNAEFFSAIAKRAGIVEFESHVSDNRALDGSVGAATEVDKLIDHGEAIVGMRKYTLRGKDRDGHDIERGVLLKFKSSAAGLRGFCSLFKAFGDDAYEIAEKYGPVGLGVTSRGHLEVCAAKCAMMYPAVGRIRPEVYECVLDPARDRFLVAMEFIPHEERGAGGLSTSRGWTHRTRCQVLSALAHFHAHFLLERTDEIERVFEGTLQILPKCHLFGLPMWRVLDRATQQEFPQTMNSVRRKVIDRYFDKLGEITEELEAYPMTFVHADCHAGNMFMRRNPTKEQSPLVLFDWETCGIHVPQRDVVQFLTYTLCPPGKTLQETMQAWSECTEHYRMELLSAISERSEKLQQVFSNKELFTRITAYMALEVYCNRAAIASVLPESMRIYDCAEGLINVLSYPEAAHVDIPLLRDL